MRVWGGLSFGGGREEGGGGLFCFLMFGLFSFRYVGWSRGLMI